MLRRTYHESPYRITQRRKSWTCPCSSFRRKLLRRTWCLRKSAGQSTFFDQGDVEPLPQILKESVGLVTLTPREQVQQQDDEHIWNVRVFQLIPQERTSERIMIRSMRRLLKCQKFQAEFLSHCSCDAERRLVNGSADHCVS